MEHDRTKIIQIRLHREDVVARVRVLARNGKVAYSDHAYDQMDIRSLNDRIATGVLEKGEPKGDVEPGNKPGEWKIKMVDRIKGAREVGVVTILVGNRDLLLVKTVEWEDL